MPESTPTTLQRPNFSHLQILSPAAQELLIRWQKLPVVVMNKDEVHARLLPLLAARHYEDPLGELLQLGFVIRYAVPSEGEHFVLATQTPVADGHSAEP